MIMMMKNIDENYNQHRSLRWLDIVFFRLEVPPLKIKNASIALTPCQAFSIGPRNPLPNKTLGLY